jgi:hypothetical protein
MLERFESLFVLKEIGVSSSHSQWPDVPKQEAWVVGSL